MQELTKKVKDSGVLEIRQRMGQISGGCILDVGTWQGDFIGTLMKSLKDYKEFVGIDISAKDLEVARESYQGKPVRFEVMNAEDMTFDDGSFDTVCISYSLHHLESVGAVLEEILRVLRPGGHLIVQEEYSDGDQSDAQRTEILIHHLDSRVDRMNGIPHVETFSRQKLIDIVNDLGMSKVETYESTNSLKCLFCKSMKECEDPKSERSIKLGLNGIDRILESAKDLSSFRDIGREAEHLRERAKRFGFESSSQLFFICVK